MVCSAICLTPTLQNLANEDNGEQILLIKFIIGKSRLVGFICRCSKHPGTDSLLSGERERRATDWDLALFLRKVHRKQILQYKVK